MSDFAIIFLIFYGWGALGFALTSKSRGWPLFLDCFYWGVILSINVGAWAAKQHEGTPPAKEPEAG